VQVMMLKKAKVEDWMNSVSKHLLIEDIRNGSITDDMRWKAVLL
jgi:hypothetical protein